MFRTLAAFFLLCALPLAAQSNTGELRLKFKDPSGLAVQTTLRIRSDANGYNKTLTTAADGTLDLQRLPYGIYRIDAQSPGFAPAYNVRKFSVSLRPSRDLEKPPALMRADQHLHQTVRDQFMQRQQFLR